MADRSDIAAPDPLPADVARLFWECAPGTVTWEAHRDAIVDRVLVRGEWDAIVWVPGRVGDDGLRAHLRRSRGRGLSRRQLRFWQLVLDLPAAEVDDWLADPAREIWDRRCEPRATDAGRTPAPPARPLGRRRSQGPDLAATTIAAIVARGSRRDFVDVHALFAAGATLESMLAAYRAKYATDELGHVLMALAYFDDAEREPMPEMLDATSWKDVSAAVEGAVRRVAR